MNNYTGNLLAVVLAHWHTGCSTVVIKRSLVDDNKLTGAEDSCVLIDGTVRKTPVAEVEVNTPYYQGKVRAVCMRSYIDIARVTKARQCHKLCYHTHRERKS